MPSRASWIVFKETRKPDPNEQDFAFQKLRSKQVLINWKPQNIGSFCDNKDSLFLFLRCGFTNWAILLSIKRTEASDSTLYYLALGYHTSAVFLGSWFYGLLSKWCLPTSWYSSHGSKYLPLILPSFMTCCTCLFGKGNVGPQFQKTRKGQFSFQSQRKAKTKNAQTTTQLHSSHTLVK